MTTPDRDDLLWRLGLDLDSEESGGGVPEDAVLDAYRRGELPEEAERRVESVLVASPAARRRLAELAGLAPARPPERIRERFLEAFASRPQESGRRRGGSRARWVALAAAALLAVVAGVAVQRQLAAPPLPSDLAYEVSATGLAEVRGEPGRVETGPTESAAIEAVPETVLRIAASPTSGASEGLEVALYRRLGDALVRLEPGPRLRVRSERGTVRFEGRAAELLGAGPGRHDLWVVAARAGDLAPAYPVGDGDPLRVLEREGRRLAYRLSVVLRSPTTTSSPDTVEVP